MVKEVRYRYFNPNFPVDDMAKQLVVVRDKKIDVGYLDYVKESLYQQSRSTDSSILIRLNPSSFFTPVDAFLIHVSCNRLLCEFTQSELIHPYQLFKLCQALQPDRQRAFHIAVENDFSGESGPVVTTASD